MEYTHILCIKLWSSLGNCTIDHNNIENKIKNLLNEKTFTETVKIDGINHTVSITWFKQKWDNKDSNLIRGDLVANIQQSNTYDPIIFEHTKMLLKKIEYNFKKENEISLSSEIIFNIVKPLTKLKPRVESVILGCYL